MGGRGHDILTRLILDPEKQKRSRKIGEGLRKLRKAQEENKKQEADKPRQEFVKTAKDAGYSENMANFMWRNRCKCGCQPTGDYLVSSK